MEITCVLRKSSNQTDNHDGERCSLLTNDTMELVGQIRNPNGFWFSDRGHAEELMQMGRMQSWCVREALEQGSE